MKKRFLTLSITLLSGIFLASCGETNDFETPYATKRDGLKEISQEEANNIIASRPTDIDALYKTYSDQNYKSIKATEKTVFGDITEDFTFVYDLDTLSFSIDYSKEGTRDDLSFKYNYNIFAYFENSNYVYSFDLHFENYPIYKLEETEVSGIGTIETSVVASTKTGDIKFKGNTESSFTNYVQQMPLSFIGNISLKSSLAASEYASFFTNEKQTYFWSEFENENQHVISVSENNLIRYESEETSNLIVRRKWDYFNNNQLDSKNNDFSSYTESSLLTYLMDAEKLSSTITKLIEDYNE